MHNMLAAARAGVVLDRKIDIALKVEAKPGRYSIGDSFGCAEWGWNAIGVWEMASRDGVRWDNDGKLNDPHPALRNLQEHTRVLILEHFGLESIADQLPLATIALIPPSQLYMMRRNLEKERGFPRMDDMKSDRGGDHCSAEHCH
jgi:hypothetical protein